MSRKVVGLLRIDVALDIIHQITKKNMKKVKHYINIIETLFLKLIT